MFAVGMIWGLDIPSEGLEPSTTQVKSLALYQLSYNGLSSSIFPHRDLNPGPLGESQIS